MTAKTRSIVSRLRSILKNAEALGCVKNTEIVAIEQAAEQLKCLDAVRASIEAVIGYNWSDELGDFQENEESRPSHIFRHLVRLNNYVHRRNDKTEDYLDKLPAVQESDADARRLTR